VRYEIPEHRTFVEFGPDVQMDHPSGASTAPAAMANCIRDSLDAGQVFVVTPSSAGLPAESSPSVMPGIAYFMSPRSAMAWGRVLVFPQCVQAGYGGGHCVEACAADEGAASTSLGQQEEDGDASDDEEEDSIMCPVYSESAALPSAGSAGHGAATCRRCCFFPKGRCSNGAECGFCHFAHEKRKTSNAKKKKHKRKKARRAGKGPSLARGGGCEAAGTAQVFLQDGVMSYVMVVPVSLPLCEAGHAGAG
jgi:hypothetical protein